MKKEEEKKKNNRESLPEPYLNQKVRKTSLWDN
jgi:hypothetical protein